LDLIRIEKFTTFSRNLRGGPRKKRDAIARAFVAKAEYTCRQPGLYWTDWHVIKVTAHLWLGTEGQNTKRITFSRAFAEFADSQLPSYVHQT